MSTIKNIRNFSIIAHIDHGKTTLSDRLLEITNAVTKRDMQEQLLDSMELERERGITIKSHFVRLEYDDPITKEKYILNLIDTPGHIDFTYEVSRSLAACEGALLVIDSTQGVEAQTVANTYLAMENDLTLIPVMNKIDLASNELEKSLDQVESVIGIDREEAINVSAKTGIGINELIPAIIDRIPPPVGDIEKPLKALIFDSWFDEYRGVIILVKIIDGKIKKNDKIKFLSNNSNYDVNELGVFTPVPLPLKELSVGEVGYIIGSIKNVSEVKIGDTITHLKGSDIEPMPGFKEPQPMVFSGFYPGEGSSHEELRDAIEKLTLNDSSFKYEPETSPILGIGFRCGFLGLLHKEIIQERLEREYNLSIVTTAPSVKYRVTNKKGEVFEIESPAGLPEPQQLEMIEEPYIESIIITPEEHLGNIIKLLQNRRGIHKKMDYISSERVHLTYDLPLAEVLYDFFNKLKSISRGYASFDYEFKEYTQSPLIKLDILINGDPVDALALIVHKEKAYNIGNLIASKMKAVIPKQLFEVVIQAAIHKRVIAKTVVKAMRKNVLAKCYGGDISRKMKLLDKQKKGKKRMKRIGKVDIPQEAFLAALEID